MTPLEKLQDAVRHAGARLQISAESLSHAEMFEEADGAEICRERLLDALAEFLGTQHLKPAGYRCCECGRLDANSNQPCTEHGDVEQVYRIVEGPPVAPESHSIIVPQE